MAFGAPFELALLARREVAFSTVILPSIVKKEEGQNSVSAQELTMHGSVTKDKPDMSCPSVDEHPGSSSTANGVSIIHNYLSKQSNVIYSSHIVNVVNVIWRERRWYVPQHEGLSDTHTHTHTHTHAHTEVSCVTSLNHMNASPSEKNMKTVLHGFAVGPLAQSFQSRVLEDRVL